MLSISTVFSVFAYTLVFPIITASLVSRSFSGMAVGVMASTVYLSIFVFGLIIPRFIHFLGNQNSYTVGKIALTFGFVVLLFSEIYWVWLIANILLGFGAAVIWPLTEGAIATFAPDDKKGSAAGLYQTGLGLAFAGGPFIASAFAVDKNRIFLFAAIISFTSWIPAFRFPWLDEKKLRDQFPDARLGFKGALASGLVIAAFIGGLFENGLNSIVIALGIHLGLKTPQAISLAGIIGTGSFMGPYPIGRLADRIGIRRVLSLSLILLSLSMCALFVVKTCLPLIWILTLLWGVIGAGLYTLSLTAVAVHFQGPLVLRATSLMVTIYTMGAFAGPFLGGIAFDFSKDFGLPVTFLVLAATALAIHLSLRQRGGLSPTPG